MKAHTQTQSDAGIMVYHASLIVLFLTTVCAVTLKYLVPETIGDWPDYLILFAYTNNALLAGFVLICGMRLLFKEVAEGEIFILLFAIAVAFINLTNEIRSPQSEILSWSSAIAIMLLVGFTVKRAINELK